MILCSFDECRNPKKVKGLCNGHYQQQYRGEDLRDLLPHRTQVQIILDEEE